MPTTSGHPALIRKAFDTPLSRSYPHNIEVHFSSDTEIKLTRLAAEQGRDSEALVQEAVERMVNYDEWFLREVGKGLAAADRVTSSSTTKSER
jgi:predicted transcriptional regulator